MGRNGSQKLNNVFMFFYLLAAGVSPSGRTVLFFKQNNGGQIYSNTPKKITLVDLNSTSLNLVIYRSPP
jgi:hypothetical protein